MQCRLGCEAQRATTLLYSNALAGTLNQLQGLYCQHGSEAHKAPARGVDEDGLYVLTAYASWPPRLSAIFALAIADAETLEPTPIHDATILVTPRFFKTTKRKLNTLGVHSPEMP